MTLLLLAPIGLDHDFWNELHVDGAVVAHDLPGFGGRPRSPRRATMRDWVDDVAVKIENSGLGPVDLVGCSLGGMVSQNLAIERPELVHSLVLACTGSRGDASAMRQRAERVEAVGMSGVVDETLDRWFTAGALGQYPSHPGVDYARSTLLALPPGAFADGWRVIGDHHATSRLSKIDVPTTCVAATEDRAAPVERVAALSQGIPGSRLATITGSHMAPLEDGPGFTKVVIEHLAWAASCSTFVATGRQSY